jgi:tetratricopeptide (TPR) repeat protein
LDAGADVNAPQPIGRIAPLKFAAGYGNAPMVQRLLELGADPHATDERGATALDAARHNMEGTPSRQAAYAQIVRLLEAAIRGAKSARATEVKPVSDAPGEDFFDYWRENRVASMTLLDLHEDGALYYYESPYSCTVWVFVGVESLLISYRIKGEGPEQVRAETRRLLDVLHGRGDPAGVMTQFYPNYAARRNAATGELKVANFRPGDWFGLTRLELPVHWDQLPGDWPAAHRSRIADLVTERIRIAEQSDSYPELNAFARALAAQSRYADAERILRRALVICEKTVGPEHEDAAFCVHSVGSALAFQARYPEAEAMFRRALELWTRLRGPDDPNVASALRSIGAVLERSSKLSGQSDEDERS